MISPKYTIYHDLIGFKLAVKPKSKQNKFIDSGIIINDTKNLLIAKKDNKIKKYVKKDYIFRLMVKEGLLEIDGNNIIGAPENRLRSLKKKKRMKK